MIRRGLAALLLVLTVLPARADPSPVKIRVLVQNIYGRHENDCEARFRALAAKILAASPPYDVVAFQEHWKLPINRIACDAAVLTKAMEADGRYKGPGRSIKHLPSTDDALQVAGGVSIFTLHKIVDAHQARFVNSRDFPLSGYALARVELAPGVQFDLWNAHLEAGSDGCDDDCRWEQATDLGSEVEMFSGVPEEGKTGNPVLLVGDFNTGGPNKAADKPPFAGNGGYGNVIEALGSPRDLWLELGAGDGATYPSDGERIDYVFLPESRRMLSPSSAYVLAPLKIEVIRWKTPAGAGISDHNGLDVTLELRPRPKPAPPVAPKHAPAPDLRAPAWE